MKVIDTSISFALLLRLSLCSIAQSDDLAEFADLDPIQYNALSQAPLWVNGSDIEFFEWFPNVFIRLYYAEPATGTWVILYKAPPGSELGIHRHFGDVWGFTISGLWGYHEHKHQWMNRYVCFGSFEKKNNRYKYIYIQTI